MEKFSWVGSQEDFIDKPDVLQLNHIVVGRHGGNSKAGQNKNEDGCLVWINEKEDWEFTILLDAHHTSESAELIVEEFLNKNNEIKFILSLPTTHQTFKRLEEKILQIFQSQQFLSACRNVKGETSCLIVVRKDKYVWWFSVGDCLLYLFHKELVALGQYQLNQRQFFQWIGQVNTFEMEVPCYSVGLFELRKGENRIFLTTDGLIECRNEPYANPNKIYHSFSEKGNDKSIIRSMLNSIKDNHVKDSTTILSWEVNISKEATEPSSS